VYERVVRMLMNSDGARRTTVSARGPPVVMFVNFFEFGDRHHARSRFTTMASQLASTLQSDAAEVAELWHSTEPANVSRMAQLIKSWAARDNRAAQATDVWRNWWRDQEVNALSLAYRLPSVWMFRAFGAEFEAHRYGLHVRDYACFDGLHPNHDGRAEAMVSDLVWSSLKRGLLAASRLAPGMAYRSPPPLQVMPDKIGHLCFQFDAEGWDMLVGRKRTNRKLHEQSLMQTRAIPHIVVNEGWEFILYEPKSNTPFKPGIVAYRPGARLHFRVDTAGATRPTLELQYLESHVGMGAVALECANCQCEPRTIHAAGAVARLSTLSTAEVAVSPHPQCELRVQLLNASHPNDKGTKFKLVRLFLLGAKAASDPLRGSVALSGGGAGASPGAMADGGAGLLAQIGDAQHGASRARRSALDLLTAARAARQNQVGADSLKLLIASTLSTSATADPRSGEAASRRRYSRSARGGRQGPRGHGRGRR
jgi:hypothetical protein